MSDPIDRQAAIDAAIEAADEWDGGMNPERAKIIGRAILNLPAVQSQSEIIRCKDCMHNGSFDTDCPINWNGKEYCSFAERRTDEQSG